MEKPIDALGCLLYAVQTRFRRVCKYENRARLANGGGLVRAAPRCHSVSARNV